MLLYSSWKSRPLKRPRIWPLRSPKRQILGSIRANGAEVDNHQNAGQNNLKPTSSFCRINGKIPQDNRQDYIKDISVVFGQRTSYGRIWLCKRPTLILKEIYDAHRLALSISVWTLNEVLDLKDFIKGSRADSFTGTTDAGGYCALLWSTIQGSFFKWGRTIWFRIVFRLTIISARQLLRINQEEETTILWPLTI